MELCPECGSQNIIPELNLLTDETTGGHKPLYTKLVEQAPPKKPFLWMAQEVKSYFQASVCGDCGHTRIYARSPGELLAGFQKGFVSEG